MHMRKTTVFGTATAIGALLLIGAAPAHAAFAGPESVHTMVQADGVQLSRVYCDDDCRSRPTFPYSTEELQGLNVVRANLSVAELYPFCTTPPVPPVLPNAPSDYVLA
jgi:hypothetical protein